MASIPDQLFPPYEEVPDADSAVAPHQRLRLREGLALVEYAAARLSGDLVDHWPRGDGHPVLVLPGFLAGPGTTRLMRDLLQKLGYQAYDWGLGWNLGHRPQMAEALATRVVDLQRLSGGQQVSLIGWSAGGIFARELARAMPERIRMVITMGSPFRGNHRATHSWWTWQLFNRHPEAAELMSEAARISRATPLTVPTTCIYSKHDGIVAWECCTSLPAPRTENVQVRSTHLGYGHNLETLYVVADRLAQRADRWRPYSDEPLARRAERRG